MIRKEDVTVVGKFQRTHALHGELNAMLDIDCGFLEEDHPLIIEIEGIFVPFYLESVRPKGSCSSLIKLKGVDCEDEAGNFVNKDIYALKDDVAEYGGKNEEGDYADDFVGYRILTTDGNYVGEITDLDFTTENVLFIVNAGDKEIYIPVADEYIIDIDGQDKTLTMNLPEGLLDMN